MKEFGIVLENPRVLVENPQLNHLIVLINGTERVAVKNGESRTRHISLGPPDADEHGAGEVARDAEGGSEEARRGYAPAASQAGSTAVHMDDPNIVGWASGWENYEVGSNCWEIWQTPEKALGKAAGTSYDIVCLGRGGKITLTFECGIGDGTGYDFAVFENSFSDTFLELGYVEVSSDGVNFFCFANDSLTESPVGRFGAVDPTNIGGFGGKYRQGYGTPFNVALLADISPLLDTNNIKWVRIVDIVGDGSYFDTSGDVIYDPYPTTGSAGFDLDAIAVLNMRTADFNQSGNVDYLDLLMLVESWLSQAGDENWNGRCDISDPADGIINLLDFAVFARQWLEGGQS